MNFHFWHVLRSSLVGSKENADLEKCYIEKGLIQKILLEKSTQFNDMIDLGIEEEKKLTKMTIYLQMMFNQKPKS